jgi:multisubunit Na+/H+ antiporter MnhF subunit
MKNLKKLAVTTSALFVAGTSAFAQLNSPLIPQGQTAGTGNNIGNNLQNIVLAFKSISTGIYSSLIVVALIAFSFGIIRTLFSNKPEDKAAGLKSIGFGIVALFAMVGIWGLVSFLSSNLGIGLGGDIPTPGVPSSVRTY